MARKTPLYEKYADLPGVKTTDYFGWILPVSFREGIVAEHNTVRTSAGLFDVSHMGRILFEGPTATPYVERLITGRIPAPRDEVCAYSIICDDNGGCIDDVIVYPLAGDRIEVVVNASNREAVLDWIASCSRHLSDEVTAPTITDMTESTAQLAVQGPNAVAIAESIVDCDLPSLRYYGFTHAVAAESYNVMISRTGYTGEDGLEMYCRASDAGALWDLLTDAGNRFGLQPCGLGSRDTLRFEAGMPLYGHEIDRSISPLEASLGRFVDLEKDAFFGRDALIVMSEAGIPRKRIGLVLEEKGVPRQGMRVFQDGRDVGVVTSGGKCHTEDIFGAMAIVDTDTDTDAEFLIEIRDNKKQAAYRALPFYSRRRKK